MKFLKLWRSSKPLRFVGHFLSIFVLGQLFGTYVWFGHLIPATAFEWRAFWVFSIVTGYFGLVFAVLNALSPPVPKKPPKQLPLEL